MHHMILLSVACLAIQYFFTLSYKQHDFLIKKKVFNTKCLFCISLQHLSKTLLIPRRIQQDMIKNVHCPSCKVPVIPVTV